MVNPHETQQHTSRQTAQHFKTARKRAVATLVLLAGLLITGETAKADQITSQFSKSDENSTITVDHAPFTTLLKTYVKTDATGLNRVNYQAMKADRPALKAYIQQLATIKVSALKKAEQFALWANLYNALTLDVVTAAYPVASIRDIDISPGLFSNGPWGKKLIIIEGASLSLDDIEHKILRPVFKDPRVHYAVNCASIGCPNLGKEAFTGPMLERQLQAAATAYINSKRGLSIKNGNLIASKIYSWFQKDFGVGESGVLTHLKKYANPTLKAKLQQAAKLDGYEYDWSLNDQKQ